MKDLMIFLEIRLLRTVLPQNNLDQFRRVWSFSILKPLPLFVLLYLYHYQILFIITNKIKKTPFPGFIKAEMGRSADGHRSSLTAGERTPTRPKASDRITLGSHGNSAFQPITASCKIVPQAQPPSPAESPGKSFQPITMSCKIVSGNCLQSFSRHFYWFACKPL